MHNPLRRTIAVAGLAATLLAGCASQSSGTQVATVCATPEACEAPPTCGGVTCPALPGYTAACNTRAHCEYTHTSPASLWPADDVWIYVPAGSFPMGAPATEDVSNYNERPVHPVTFARGFFIGKYAVTTSTYEACEAVGRCTEPSVADSDAGGWGLNRTTNDRATHPQNGITWAQASAVCAWQAARLPSEAEWEYAAKGPTTHRTYPWGDAPAPTCANDTAVMDEGCGVGGTWPVGQKAAGLSAVGALDMAGNLWEWVEDCWHEDYSGAPSDGLPWTTDCADSDRMARGGSFTLGAPSFLRAARRDVGAPTLRHARYGVRCVRPLP